MSKITEECKNCEFCFDHSGDQGQCHRYAPRPSREERIENKQESDIKVYDVVWPWVYLSDYCGDYVESTDLEDVVE